MFAPGTPALVDCSQASQPRPPCQPPAQRLGYLVLELKEARNNGSLSTGPRSVAALCPGDNSMGASIG